jgi:hypothetical protein
MLGIARLGYKLFGKNLMALAFAAYFDASGKHDIHPVITVAGAVSTVTKWVRFEKQWCEVLKREGIKEFHATDLFSFQGEFKSWKGDHSRRTKFVVDLAEIAKANVNKIFSISVELAAWNVFDEDYYFSERFHSPFAFASFGVIDQVIKWAKRKRLKKLPDFIFEDGDDGWEGVCDLCKWDKIVPIRLPKAKAVPCQLGDMLAWKGRIAASNALNNLRRMESEGNYDDETINELRREMDSLNKLYDRFPGEANLFSPEAMKRTCEKNNVPRRGPTVL